MDEEIINRKLDRRRLLGRAGAVAATVVGAGAVGSALNAPASADVGQPVLLGNPLNDAEDQSTGIVNDDPDLPTLVLNNQSVTTVVPDTWEEGGPALAFEPRGTTLRGPSGALGVSTDGALWTIDQSSFAAYIRNSLNSPVLLGFPPVRLLDTRNANGRRNVLNPSVIDSNGFVGAGQTLHLSLDEKLNFAWTALGNAAAINPKQNGFLTVFPYNTDQPTTSNINYQANVSLANFCMVAVGFENGVVNNAISIFVATSTRLLFDLSAATVVAPGDIVDFGGAGLGAGARAGSRVRQHPSQLGGQPARP
jgi:hypothetical protein